MESILEIIRNRRSVRTFAKQPVDAEKLAALKAYAASLANPWNIPVEFVFMDAKQYKLSSPVLSGEPVYIAAKVAKIENGELAVGYEFEELMLKACAMNLGTVWIGGTMKRELFEKACEKKDDERMPCISPLGTPAKMSFRETMMRKGVKADTRMKNEQLFFHQDMNHALFAEDEAVKDALEAVRLAPSAVNKQPWRIIFKDGLYHFYEFKSGGYESEAVGDMQKIDIGIALCHFELVLKERGYHCAYISAKPEIDTDPAMQYIVSLRVQKQ